MLFNITLSILALIVINVVIFSIARFIPKKTPVLKEELSSSVETIKLNLNLEDETSNQELAPTGS
ncbi:hypothetical protein [Algibacter sp. 2305UL17-15]|uniref:hypothetical protein n=1 Tax=Algibacter sp. 2305UL17-15 TaxID=3231268 RepID=UPI00345B270F